MKAFKYEEESGGSGIINVLSTREKVSIYIRVDELNPGGSEEHFAVWSWWGMLEGKNGGS